MSEGRIRLITQLQEVNMKAKMTFLTLALGLLFVGVAGPSLATPVPLTDTAVAVPAAADPYVWASDISTGIRMVQECTLVDHDDCSAPAQQNDDCSGAENPPHKCHCIVTPTRLCVKN
jgi:hypothetical protein